MGKKSVTQVFIFMFSAIMISSCAFLIINFSSGFLEDTKGVSDEKFYSKIKEDIVLSKKSRGDEKYSTYEISQNIKNVCFSSKNSQSGSCISQNQDILEEDEITGLINNDINIFVFSKDSLLKTIQGADFSLRNNECKCITPNLNKIEIYFVNDYGEVFLEFN